MDAKDEIRGSVCEKVCKQKEGVCFFDAETEEVREVTTASLLLWMMTGACTYGTEGEEQERYLMTDTCNCRDWISGLMACLIVG